MLLWTSTCHWNMLITSNLFMIQNIEVWTIVINLSKIQKFAAKHPSTEVRTALLLLLMNLADGHEMMFSHPLAMVMVHRQWFMLAESTGCIRGVFGRFVANLSDQGPVVPNFHLAHTLRCLSVTFCDCDASVSPNQTQVRLPLSFASSCFCLVP